MPYSLPSPGGAADFGLAGSYLTPPASAVDFGLADGIVWPAYPGLVLRVGLPWGTAADQDRARTLAHTAAAHRDDAPRLRWQAAPARARRQTAPWADAPRREGAPLALPWQPGHARAAAKASPWGDAPTRQRAASAPWDASGGPRQHAPAMPWIDPPARRASRALPWQSTRRNPTPGAGAGAGMYWLPTGATADHSFVLTESYRRPPLALPAPPGPDFDLARPSWIVEVIEPLPRDRSSASPWGRAQWRNLRRTLPWGWGHSHYRKDARIEAPYPDTDAPVMDLGDGPGAEPVIQESYHMTNLVTVERLPDLTPLLVRDLTVALDVDAWAWTFTGTLIGAAALALVAPGPTGLTDVRITLNTHQWVFMIERFSQQRDHADDRYTIHGVSRTQYLAAPYAPRRSKRNAAQLNAVQAADEELDGTAYLLDWVTSGDDITPDWTYPAGTFVYQDKTPAEVIQGIAASAGAVLIANRTLDRWRLQPRFRASPWAIAAADPDAIVHWTQVRRQALEYRPAPLYDAAYVSGTHAGWGVEVVRSGTPGTSPAPDVFDDAVVAVDQAKERGRQLIAASGAHAIVELELALPEAMTAPGLIEPGDLLAYVGASAPESWRGYVLGTTLTAPGSGAALLIQTVRVIRFYEH